MPLTPLDIHNKEFRKAFRGYAENEVDDFLDEVVRDFEALLKENVAVKDELRRAGEQLDQYRNLEETLNKTLIVAQETAEEVKEAARKEAELVVREAREKAEAILREAQARAEEASRQLEELQREAHQFRVRMRSFLQAQLALFSEQEPAIEAATGLRRGSRPAAGGEADGDTIRLAGPGEEKAD